MADKTEDTRWPQYAPFTGPFEAGSFLIDHGVLADTDRFTLQEAQRLIAEDPERLVVWRAKVRILGTESGTLRTAVLLSTKQRRLEENGPWFRWDS